VSSRGAAGRATLAAAVVTLAAAPEIRALEAASTPAATAPSPTVRELDSPAAAESLAPSLAVASDGRAFLSWLEPRERGHALRFAARAADGSWSEPRTIAEGERFFANWADVPRLAASGDGPMLVAHWLEKRAGGTTYDYDVLVARSHDAGRSWDAPQRLYADATPGEHGFVSAVPLEGGRVGTLFLDGREAGRAGGAMTLRFAAVPREGPPEPDQRIDERVCDCCQTALARTARGLVAAFRDRSPDEVRDISVARFQDGRWSPPATPHADGWKINGCPVNGPALAARGDRVALAWFTLGGGAARVKLALSSDGGGSFAAPAVVDDGRPIGRVDVAFATGAEAPAVVSWIERTDAGAALRLRRVAGAGEKEASFELGRVNADRSSGFPRILAVPDGLLVVWRDAGAPARLRTALVAWP
jgi:hypothetical protein